MHTVKYQELFCTKNVKLINIICKLLNFIFKAFKSSCLSITYLLTYSPIHLIIVRRAEYIYIYIVYVILVILCFILMMRVQIRFSSGIFSTGSSVVRAFAHDVMGPLCWSH